MYDDPPVHPGPGSTKLTFVWVQAVRDGLDGYAKEWLRHGGKVDATYVSCKEDFGTGGSLEEFDTGYTLLMAACMSARSEFIAYLLDHGAAVDKQDFNGITALGHACGLDRYDYRAEECVTAIVKRLLLAGADPSAGGPGRSALDIARAWPGWPAGERLLVERHAPFDDAAQQHAAQLAATAGKPATRLQGLVAIHAVLNRKCFARDEDAWCHYGTSRQRFYEWKALLNGRQQLVCDVFRTVSAVPVSVAVPVPLVM